VTRGTLFALVEFVAALGTLVVAAGTGMSRRSDLFRMPRDHRRSSWRSRFTRSFDSSLSNAAGEAPATPATRWSAPIAESAPSPGEASIATAAPTGVLPFV
jgi:hypothetical protein